MEKLWARLLACERMLELLRRQFRDLHAYVRELEQQLAELRSGK